MQRESAVQKVVTAHTLLASTQDQLKVDYRYFAEACRAAHEAGIPDRELSEITGYSRQRIQQFRCESVS